MALTDALVYWALDENTGTSVSDASGNSVTASLVGSPSWTTGRINSGVTFNGSSQNIRSTSNSYINGKLSGGLSISVWVNLISNSGTQRIVEIANAVDTAAYYYIQHDSSLGVMFGSLAGSTYLGTNVSLGTGSWHHLVGTTDWASEQIYVDGTAQSTTGPGASAAPGALALGYIDVALLLFGSSSFYGNIIADEVGIWGRALSGAEVTTLYNSGSGFNPYGSGGGGGSRGLFMPPNLVTGAGGSFFSNKLT